MSSRILQVADIPVDAEGGEPFAGEEPARGGKRRIGGRTAGWGA